MRFTVAMCGGAFFMVLINKSESSGQAMLCMMLSISCNALGNAGVLVLPQDMSPKFAGTLFGIMNSAGAFSGIVGTLITGHLLEKTHRWEYVFNLNAVLLISGALIFLLFATAKKIA
ncbi:putative anion transporter 4 [Acropora cervicornis]|uniref:Anion transporter 4 n=1 Tax=Acropora cervicornis TaxID=6130 RepID=A0AAD9QRL2_ACRCE|nr:putative anion transporter 4 [Acropora cervicornis]